MNKTANYNLNLPSGSDVIDIDIINDNTQKIDNTLNVLSKEVEPIETSETLNIISASGIAEFYHGTATATCFLDHVKTTWGKAVFGQSYGKYNTSAGAFNALRITLYVKNGIIYWDEYYNGEYTPETAIDIGRAECVSDEIGNTKCTFDYVNNEPDLAQVLSLRQSIISLMARVQILEEGVIS